MQNRPLDGFPALRIVGIIFAVIGVLFLAAGLAVVQYFGHLLSQEDALGLTITSFVIGGIFTILGICLLAVHSVVRKRQEGLRREGTCYEAEVVNAYPSSVQVNNRVGIVLECTYKDAQGATHLVKSQALWGVGLLRDKNACKVRVWVDPYDAKKYFVEVVDDGISSSVDYDDR